MGFTAALVVGYAAGNSAFTILIRAIGAFFVCLLVGQVIGGIAQRTIESDIAAYKRAHPIPDEQAAAHVSSLTGSAERKEDGGSQDPDQSASSRPAA